MSGSTDRVKVAVLYNHVDEDEYEKLKEVDPSTLEFQPEYDIHVATVTEEYDAIVKALRRSGFRARAVNIQDDVKRLERVLRRSPPDVIFNLIEHFRDDPSGETNVAALYELHRVAYTGAPPFALEVAQRKGLTKLILQAHGVPTPRFHLVDEGSIRERHGLRYPLIVKPAREDASSGVDRDSVVGDYMQLSSQVERIFREFGAPVLIEEFIDGGELHVSILGNDPPRVLPVIEWDFSTLPPDYPPIITYAAKWNPLAEVYHRVHSVCPARLPKRVLQTVERVALEAYRTVGCRDYARLDIRLSKSQKPYVLEVNPNPDLTEGVSFMESAGAGGFTFEEALVHIAGLALQRRQAPKPDPAERASTPAGES